MFWFLCLVAAIMFIRWQWKRIHLAHYRWRKQKLENAEKELAAISARLLALYERDDEEAKVLIAKYQIQRRKAEYRIDYMKRNLA